MASRNKKDQPDILQSIVMGIGKFIWWLVKLPFKGLKGGQQRGGISTEDRNYLTSKRLELEKMLSSSNPIELKHALIESDKLVDHAMKLQGLHGETFADRLRSAQQRLNPDLYNKIWQGHKVRNEVVHEQGDRIGLDELRIANEKLLSYLKNI